jgi:TPR repeat protein
MKWYTKAAEQRDAEAQFRLAWIFFNEKNLLHDDSEAVVWCERAAEQGHAGSQTILAAAYYEGKGIHQDYTKAAKWAWKSAEQGIAPAQHLLGEMYSDGKGLPKDDKEAAEWYRKAANQGFEEAQTSLGWLYYNGRGVPQDYKKAVEWGNKAAGKGYARAQFLLGWMFYFGEGHPQNYKYAYAMFSLAAAQGNNLAADFRDKAAYELNSGQLSQAQEYAAAIQSQIDSPTANTDQPFFPARGKQPQAFGTGFLVTKDGYILTCRHVVAGATSIKVKIQDRLYVARLEKEDSANDLALLRINGNFPALSFSDKSPAHMGQEVFTIGLSNRAIPVGRSLIWMGMLSVLSFQHSMQEQPTIYPEAFHKMLITQSSPHTLKLFYPRFLTFQ